MPSQTCARIQVRATSTASVNDAWNLLIDWQAQSRWIPLTRVVNDNSITGAGARFTARTGFSHLGFDDPMEVTVWEPPGPRTAGRCAVVKHGRWIRGTAEILVAPTPGSHFRTAITWIEDVRVAGVPATFNPLVRVFGGALFRRALRLALRELEVR